MELLKLYKLQNFRKWIFFVCDTKVIWRNRSYMWKEENKVKKKLYIDEKAGNTHKRDIYEKRIK